MGESGSMLSLDPAVLFLQIVAFIILFLVLRRYLFRPLLNVMQEREREIDDALQSGEKARAELERIDQERERVLEGARDEGRQQVRAAVQEGEQARNRIVSEARDEAQEIRRRAQETLDLERREAALQLRREVVELALLAAQKAVLTQLDEENHRRSIDDFIANLEQRQ